MDIAMAELEFTPEPSDDYNIQILNCVFSDNEVTFNAGIIDIWYGVSVGSVSIANTTMAENVGKLIRGEANLNISTVPWSVIKK